jgi:hypothetical protein
MREHKSEKLPPWRVLIPVEDVAEAGQSFALAADAEARGAIARMVGLRDLPRLEANFEVTPQGSGGLRVVGRVCATVGQNCVVTLEPLTNDVEEDVDLLFMPQSARIEGEGEAGAGGSPADTSSDHAEPLIGGVIDLGALATEFLVLGLDPYPRKPGAVFEPPRQERPDESPFAALAALKGRQ